MKGLSTVIHKLGLRMTSQRQQIYAAVSDHPQSVAQIDATLKKQGMTVDTVTVYRTVERFCALGLITRTQFQDGTMMYERNEKNHHHHHLICDVCGKIEDIQIDEKRLLTKMPQTHGFQIRSHTLEFFGLCKKCQHHSV